jgi:surface polysaccharide O-acyltransferase-like enzyme
MNTIQSTNIQYIDTLRALAIIGVIVIHITSPLVNMTYGKIMPYWWIGNIVNSAVRFAVPLFLMLSGTTLLGKEYRLGEFYKKRMMRVLVPFLFWIWIYWIYRWLMLMPKQQPHGISDITKWSIDLFLNEGVSKHFWYIYMILFIYLLVPFIGKIVLKASRKALTVFLIAWVLLCVATYSMNLSFYKWTGDYPQKILGYFQFSGFLVLGYFLGNTNFKKDKTRFISMLIFIITVIVSAVIVYLVSKHNHKLNLRIYSYFSLNTIIQSIAVFLLFKDIRIKNIYLIAIQKTISKYSYGIYLLHIIIIGVLFRNGIYWSFAHPLVSLSLLTFMVLAGSLLIISILHKIPGGKYLAG